METNLKFFAVLTIATALLSLHVIITSAQKIHDATIQIPKITIGKIVTEKAPANFSLKLEPGRRNTGAKHILQLSNKIKNVSIDCTSPSPIQWKYTGFAVKTIA